MILNINKSIHDGNVTSNEQYFISLSSFFQFKLCFCLETVQSLSKRPDAKCNTACRSNPQEMCGGILGSQHLMTVSEIGNFTRNVYICKGKQMHCYS